MNRETELLIEAAAEAIRTVVANRSGKGRPSSALPEKLRQEYREEGGAALRAAGVTPGRDVA